jgi:hypothetical protein|tara:strand:+ start:915 stop:1106 length:192 start_codon:yes stop_codon:yes gene_type:complete
MSNKNLWQKDRSALFRNLVKQYREEGYDTKEAKRHAKIELNEIMQDKEDFVADLWRESYEEDS